MRLRALTFKFDSHKMRPNGNMKQHLGQMSFMIRELKAAGNNLSVNCKSKLTSILFLTLESK